MSFHTGSRRSQPPLALAVPLSRFTPRVGGGLAFFVRPHYTFMKLSHTWFLLLVLAFGSMLPMRAAAQDDLEQRVSRLEHKVASDQGVGVAVFEIGRASCRER